LQARDVVGTGIAFLQHARDVMSLGLLAAHLGEDGWQQQLREAFSLTYWGMEILQHERVARRIGPEVVDGFLLERIWLHGLAAGGSAGPVADWTARYLADILAATGGSGETLELAADRPYALFIRHLVDANVEGTWPRGVDRMMMRAYGDLLARAPAPEAFRTALVAFCDYRVAQAFGYDGMEATRRRSEERTGSVLDIGGWIKLFPVELFSLQYVYRKTTGKALSLEADHPLLQQPFMKLPALLPLYEDVHIRRAVALARGVFGSAWKPVAG
jgi:hypothetical protein